MDDREQARLRELDAALAAVPLPTGLHARIVASAEARAGRRHLGVALVVATAAVVLAFALGRRWSPAETEDAVAHDTPAAPAIAVAPAVVTEPPIVAAAPTIATRWDGRLEAEPACSLDGDATLSVRGDCRLHLREPSLSIDVWGAATLTSAGHGVRVVDGVALFHVDRVAAGEPRVRVEVAAGAIEVIGTRFVVTQRGDGGHVDLLEGAIAFVDRDGAEHPVAPGQRLGWDATRVLAEAAALPEAIPGAPPAATPTRPLAKPAHAPVDVDAALERVAGLRRAGRYDDAIAELVRVRRSVDDPVVAEVLSFEEGTLRTRADRPDEVCAYWRGHLARFGAGDHAASIREHMASAGCTEP
jgi:hypothetical protein